MNAGHIYSMDRICSGKTADIILTEDSHAGLQFFRELYKDSTIHSETAGSNSGIYSCLKNHSEQKVFVIADGAAFGPEMDRIMRLQHQHPDRITVCLPESFEWLILQSGLINGTDAAEIIANPGARIESKEYFSWERFFSDYLVQKTAGTYMAYSKGQCSSFYLVRENMNRIVALIAVNMPEKP